MKSLVLLLFLVYIVSIQSKTVTFNYGSAVAGTYLWSSTSTWSGNEVPAAGDDVDILIFSFFFSFLFIFFIFFYVSFFYYLLFDNSYKFWGVQVVLDHWSLAIF